MTSLASVLWQRSDVPSLERCRLEDGPGGFVLRGTVIGLLDGAPTEVRYRVRADKRWRTREAEIDLEVDREPRRLELAADGVGNWTVAGRDRPGLAGCLDVDLAVSPSTNTLPVRRLRLTIGQRAPARAAWVQFPSLTVEPLEQIYERTGPVSYRYRAGAFAAELYVDEHGLVRRYGSMWIALP